MAAPNLPTGGRPTPNDPLVAVSARVVESDPLSVNVAVSESAVSGALIRRAE
jgi:hypothetical protein